MLAWITGWSDSSRLGHSSRGVNAKSIYTELVKRDLVASGALASNPELSVGSSSHSMSSWLEGKIDRIHALAYVRPIGVSDPLRYLQPQVRTVQDYWMCSSYSECPLIFVDIVDIAPCNTLVPFFLRMGHTNNATMGAISHYLKGKNGNF